MNQHNEDGEAFVLRESIWSLIEENSLAAEERLEIKAIIGTSLVEETLDLHEEMKLLLDIWRSYREDTDSLGKVKLPDPPNVRENLVKQIQMFVKLFKEKSSRGTRDLTQVLTLHQSSVVKLISESPVDDQPSKRPSSASSSSDGRQTPMRPASSGRNSSCSSRISHYLATDQREKSLSELERLADVIREELEQQRIELQNDVLFLQQCIMDESTHRQSVISSTEEPSLKDLRDIGIKLEKELLQKDGLSTNRQTEKQQNERKPLNIREKKSPSPQLVSVAQRAVPSPPSSAPTSKTRSHIAHRKQVIAKTFSFPSESSGTKKDAKQFHDKDVLITKAGSRTAVNCAANLTRTMNTTTQVAAPCVSSLTGSNSRRLRDMVLECRDSR